MAKSYNQQVLRVLLAIESNLLGFLLGFNIFKFIRAQHDHDSTFFIVGLVFLILSFFISLYFITINSRLENKIRNEEWNQCFNYIKPKCNEVVFYVGMTIWCGIYIKIATVQFVSAIILTILVMGQLSRLAKFEFESDQTIDATRAPESELELSEVVVGNENNTGIANEEKCPTHFQPSPPPPYFTLYNKI